MKEYFPLNKVAVPEKQATVAILLNIKVTFCVDHMLNARFQVHSYYVSRIPLLVLLISSHGRSLCEYR